MSVAGEIINLQEAAAYTSNFRNANPGVRLAMTFSASIVGQLLSSPGVASVRIYNGQNDDGDWVAVLVGVNAAGDDITDGVMIQRGIPCPDYCGGANALNGQ